MRIAGAFRQLGSKPADDDGKLILLAVVSLLFATAALGVLVNRRPWYLRRRVIDDGSGPLQSTTIQLR
jgi:hypothetical protein